MPKLNTPAVIRPVRREREICFRVLGIKNTQTNEFILSFKKGINNVEYGDNSMQQKTSQAAGFFVALTLFF